MNHKILLVEDEDTLGEGLKFNLELEGYDVCWLQSGTQAYDYIKKTDLKVSLDAVVLDLMLPHMNGFELLKHIKEQTQELPVLVLSARSLENDKVTALKLGADDYVTKPFSLQELILRLKRLVKIKTSQAAQPRPAAQSLSPFHKEPLKMGDSQYYPDQHVLTDHEGRSTLLSSIESALLLTFLNYANKVLSRGELLEKVWKAQGEMETRTVDVFVAKLRKLLEADPSDPKFILSVRGVGYVYVTDDKLREDLKYHKK